MMTPAPKKRLSSFACRLEVIFSLKILKKNVSLLANSIQDHAKEQSDLTYNIYVHGLRSNIIYVSAPQFDFKINIKFFKY